MPRVRQRGSKGLAASDHAALLKLYEQTTGELQKLREFEWKVAATFVTFAGAFIALVLAPSFQEVLRVDSLRWLPIHAPIRVALTVLQALVMIFGLWCLGVTHHYLTVQRRLRRNIEAVLRFHDAGVFSEAPVLPPSFRGDVRFGFQLAGLVLPLAALIVVLQLFSIYLVWTVR